MSRSKSDPPAGSEPPAGSDPPTASEPSAGAELARLVSLAGQRDDTGLRQRAAALGGVVVQLGGMARQTGVRAIGAGRWLADVVTDVAPHLTVRDAATLRRHNPGLTDVEIASRLVTTAARTTGAVGAAAGAIAALEFAAPPSLLAAPVQLAAETLVSVAVELKMVAELHEITGMAVHGGMRESAPAYLNAWVSRRAVGLGSTLGVTGLLGDAAKRQLRVRLLRRMGRSTASLAPFLAGAAAGAEINRRATRDLGEKLIAELRGMKRADITIGPENTNRSRLR